MSSVLGQIVRVRVVVGVLENLFIACHADELESILLLLRLLLRRMPPASHCRGPSFAASYVTFKSPQGAKS